MTQPKSLAKAREQREKERKPAPTAPVANDRTDAPAKRSKKPYDETHITVYAPVEAKTALEELCLALKRERGKKVTLRDLAFEAYNDVLKKHGKPPIFPNEGEL